jgi:hypothetical protein
VLAPIYSLEGNFYLVKASCAKFVILASSLSKDVVEEALDVCSHSGVGGEDILGSSLFSGKNREEGGGRRLQRGWIWQLVEKICSLESED